MKWQEMKNAPKDGTEILVARDHGCGWEHFVVWWTGDPTYPWAADNNAYPADRFDYWTTITPPEEGRYP